MFVTALLLGLVGVFCILDSNAKNHSKRSKSW